jgi:chemotaxis protein MotA
VGPEGISIPGPGRRRAKAMAAKSGGSGPQVRKKFDVTTIGGLLLAVGGIVGGLLLEGGRIRDISQITAAIIVLGGTFGAVMVTTPPAQLGRALKRLPMIFQDSSRSWHQTVEEIIGYAMKARKTGLVSLESVADSIPDPFLKKALNLAIDGTDLQELRSMMELQISLEEQRAEAEAKVFESAGGYAPTIGIIGAVMGLIQVMKNLANIEEVGHGIAVAFVATVYGVASANLFFLPAAGKIKARAREEAEGKEMMLDGVAAIVEGMNPKIIRSKLEAYLGSEAPAQKAAAAAAEAPARAARAEA